MSARIIAFCASSSASQIVSRCASCSSEVGAGEFGCSFSMGVLRRAEAVGVGTTDSKRGINPHHFLQLEGV